LFFRYTVRTYLGYPYGILLTKKRKRNASTYVMVGLGLKLEDLLKQKGLENKVMNSFDKFVDKEPLFCQNSDKPLQTKKENLTAKDKIDTKKEIANFAKSVS